jgi:hypothetical protein
MHGARLDTARRLPNLVLICEKLHQQPGKSFSAALGDGTRQAAYDLCSRSGRTYTDLLAGHVAQTIQRAREAQPTGPLIVVQDTVRLDYFTHRSCQNLGPVGASPDSYGLFGHAALALRRDGLPLGVLGVQFWTRAPAEFGSRTQRHRRTPEEKETAIWTETAVAVEQVLPADLPVILVQDREADIYPFLARLRRPHTHWVVRAYQPRRAYLWPDSPAPAVTPDRAAEPPHAAPRGGWRCPCAGVERVVARTLCPPETTKLAGVPLPGPLTDAWRHAPVRVAALTVTVPERPGSTQKPAQPERQAVVEIRSARVEILRSQVIKAADCPSRSVTCWAVWVHELAPPTDAEALHWFLLTDLRAENPAEAQEIVAIYRLRWQIENLHRVLKSSLQVERCQVDDASSLMNVLALYLVVAWRTLQLTHQARVEPEAPATSWLSGTELAVLGAKFGTPPTTLREAVRLIARLGGWPGATRRKEPGTLVVSRGIRDLAVAAEIWDLAVSFSLYQSVLSHDTS